MAGSAPGRIETTVSLRSPPVAQSGHAEKGREMMRAGYQKGKDEKPTAASSHPQIWRNHDVEGWGAPALDDVAAAEYERHGTFNPLAR